MLVETNCMISYSHNFHIILMKMSKGRDFATNLMKGKFSLEIEVQILLGKYDKNQLKTTYLFC